MKVSVSAGNMSLEGTVNNLLTRRCNKLAKLLKNFPEDLPKLEVVLFKHYRKIYSTTATKKVIVKFHNYFDGSIRLKLNNRTIKTESRDTSLLSCVNRMFSDTEEMLKRHKSRHFSSHSDYPRRRSKVREIVF